MGVFLYVGDKLHFTLLSFNISCLYLICLRFWQLTQLFFIAAAKWPAAACSAMPLLARLASSCILSRDLND